MGKSYPEASLAGAIEADDAAGGVEDYDEGAYGVEDGGDEVALDGEGGLDALAGAGGTVYLADAGVEFEAVNDLTAENGEGFGLGCGESASGCVEDEEGAYTDAVGGGEGGTGVEAEGGIAEDDAFGGVVGVLAGVADLVDGVAEDGGLAGGAAERGLDEVEAYVGLEPDAVGADEGDGGDGGVADLGGEAGDVVEDGIGRRVEDLVVGESL